MACASAWAPLPIWRRWNGAWRWCERPWPLGRRRPRTWSSAVAFETRHLGFSLSDDPAGFALARGHRWIAEESYWAQGIPFAVFERAVRGSLTVGAYAADGE